jgi:hypothetical protein
MLGPHDDAPARQALAGVVVGVADQVQRDALGQEGAEALAAGAFIWMKMVWSGRPSGPWRISSPDSIAPTVRLTLRIVLHELHLLAALERRAALLDQLDVERAARPWSCVLDLAARHVGRHRRLVEDAAEVQAARLPVFDALLRVEQVGAADQVVELRMPSCAMISRASSATKKK